MNNLEQKLANDITTICLDKASTCCKDAICASCASKGLIKLGYINGADFMNYLKEKAVWAHGVGTFYESVFDTALQNYLKGE